MTNEPYNQLTCQAISPHESQVTLHSHPHPPTPTPTPVPLHNKPTPPKKSQAISLGQFLTQPTNVAIPTTPFKCLKGLHGNCMRHCWGTTPAMSISRPTSARHLTDKEPQPRPKHTQNPGLVPNTRRTPTSSRTHKRAPASSHGDRGRGRGERGRKARAYSLTAPAVRPDTMYFCRYWNSRTTGMAAITEPAAKMPHGAVRESAAHMYMPTASVNWL